MFSSTRQDTKDVKASKSCNWCAAWLSCAQFLSVNPIKHEPKVDWKSAVDLQAMICRATRLSGLARQVSNITNGSASQKDHQHNNTMINSLWGVVVLLYKCLATPWHDYSLSEGNKCRANIESFFCWASVTFGQRSSIDCQRSAGVGAKRVEQCSITSVAVNQNSTRSNSSQTLKHKYPSINLHPKQLPLQWEVWDVHYINYIYSNHIRIYCIQDGSTSTQLQPISHVQ